jgi:uroporphyrinogen decarboxylase
MNSKQRVLKAINHEEPDRVPLDYSAKPEVSQALCEYLGLTWDGPYEHWQIHPEALMQRFHIDLRFRSARYIGDEEKTLPDGCMINRWGVVFKNGYPLIAPLAHAKTVADVEAHPWPDPSAFDYEHYAEMLEPFEEYAICGGEWSPFFTYGFEMVGMEKFLMGMVLEPELIHTVLDKICDYYLTVNEWMFQAARGKLDIFFTGDDFGS